MKAGHEWDAPFQSNNENQVPPKSSLEHHLPCTKSTSIKSRKMSLSSGAYYHYRCR